MIYHSAPNTVPNGFRVALVWRLTCPETSKTTLATETRHKLRTRGTHRFFALIATPHGTRWMPSGEWDRRRPGLSASFVGWALVHYGDGNAARMAHAAALDSDGRGAGEAGASAYASGDACEACDGEGVMTFDTGRGTFDGPTCEACDGAGHAPASPLPPIRWTADEQPVHEAPHAPAASLYEVTVPSSSRAGVAYTVTHDATGWHCTCPHWRYRKPADGCKHIRAARLPRSTSAASPRARVAA